jgi:hypothetical protein
VKLVRRDVRHAQVQGAIQLAKCSHYRDIIGYGCKNDFDHPNLSILPSMHRRRNRSRQRLNFGAKGIRQVNVAAGSQSCTK